MEENIPRNGLKLELLMDGNPLDTSGNGNHGTANSLFWDKAKRGYVKEVGKFNGISSSVDGNLDITGFTAITVNFFGKIDVRTATSLVFSLMHSGADDIRIHTSNTGLVYYSLDDGTADVIPGGPVGELHQYSITFDGTEMIAYQDCVEVGRKPASFNFATANGNYSIGKRGSGNLYSAGLFGLIRVYDRALSVKELNVLRMESLRRLGGGIFQEYPELFVNTTDYYDFRNGSLSNLIDGELITKSAGTNTVTDYLGNPNSAYRFDIGTNDKLTTNAIGNIFTGGGTIHILVNIKSLGTNTFGRLLESSNFLAYSTRAGGIDKIALNHRHSTTHGRWYLDMPTFNTNFLLTIKYDNSVITNKPKFYINGIIVATQDSQTPVGTAYNNTTAITVGNRNPGDRALDGDINLIMFNEGLDNDFNIKLLYSLIENKYIYPIAKYTPVDIPKPVLSIDGTNDGTTFFDQSGNGNHGIKVGNITTGRINKSKYIQFPGLADHIFLGDRETYSNMTLCFYINPAVNPADTPTAFGSIFDSSNDMFIFYSDKGRGTYRTKINNGNHLDIPANHLPLNEWTKVCITYNGTQEKVYINNVLVITSDFIADIGGKLNTGLVIGNNFNGKIIDFNVYDEALTPEQKEKLYYSNYN